MEDLIVVAICLKQSPRRAALELELASHDALRDRTRLYVSERDVEDGVRGCFLAHQAALRLALSLCKDPTTPILVLEDDVIMDAPDSAIASARAALEDGIAEIVAVGAIPITPMRRVKGHPHIRRAKWQLTHAYMVGQATARKITSWSFATHGRWMRTLDHYDHQLTRQLTQAIVTPTAAFQRANADVSTTSRQALYLFITSLRDAVQQRRVQRITEWLLLRVGDALDALVRLRTKKSCA